MHRVRAHTAAGKNWGSGEKKGKVKKSPAASGSVRDKLRQVLAKNPDGLSLQRIATQMKRIGWRPNGDGLNYISTLAAHDMSIIRVERGVYRLTDQVLAQQAATTAVATKAEPDIQDISKDALLVRIEQLETRLRATSGALSVFMKEMNGE